MARERQTPPVPAWTTAGAAVIPSNGHSDGLAMNGSRRLVWWMMVSFATLMLGLVSVVYSSNQSDVDRLIQKEAIHGERLSTLEAKLEESYRRLGSIETKLIAVDDKIDDTLREVRLLNIKGRIR